MRGGDISRRGFWQLACLIWLECGLSSLAHADDYTLVVHPSAGIKTATLARVRSVLSLREAQWENGSPVILVLPPRRSGPILWMAEDLLRMPEPTYRRHVLGQVFRGAAREPIMAETLPDVVKAVAGRRGAISALPRAMVSDDVTAVALIG